MGLLGAPPSFDRGQTPPAIPRARGPTCVLLGPRGPALCGGLGTGGSHTVQVSLVGTPGPVALAGAAAGDWAPERGEGESPRKKGQNSRGGLAPCLRDALTEHWVRSPSPPGTSCGVLGLSFPTSEWEGQSAQNAW